MALLLDTESAAGEPQQLCARMLMHRNYAVSTMFYKPFPLSSQSQVSLADPTATPYRWNVCASATDWIGALTTSASRRATSVANNRVEHLQSYSFSDIGFSLEVSKDYEEVLEKISSLGSEDGQR